SRGSLRNDCRRYTALAIRGWTVLRFAWEDVMLHPDYVRLALLGFVDPKAVGPEQHALLTKSALRSA
ncbi:MAG TPA: hypothetical protein VLI04_13455, partial [Nocardioidaceae bacterium]|nr:hypothetical protein [Nocardioidaceae bacterium]